MENFKLKAKSTVKRIAAISAGALMMGATVFGAAAAADYTLADYPTPFVEGGEWNGLIVVGADAASEDVAGAIGIAATIGQVSSPGATAESEEITGGETEDINIGLYLGNTSAGGFDVTLEDDDIAGLVDSSLDFGDDNYDYHDEIVFQGSGPQVMSSLTSSDDDYEDGVYIEVPRDSVKYVYEFDEDINVSTATTTDPLEIDFLGNSIKITGASSATKFTALVGEEVYLIVGDTATVEGKTVELVNVGSGGSVIVSVDGVKETVSDTEKVNGLEVDVTDYFYSDALSERSATLTIGDEAKKSYKEGDEFIDYCGTWHTDDCEETNPDWVWEIGSLTTKTTVTINVTNDYVVNGDEDNPITAGETLDIAGSNYKIEFEELTVADDNYATYTIEYDNSYDFSDWDSALTSEQAIRIYTNQDEGIITASGSEKTDEIFLHYNDTASNQTDILYTKSSDNKVYLDQTVDTSGASSTTNIAEVNYDDTKSTNVQFDLVGTTATANSLNLTLDIIDDNSYIKDGQDNITIALGHTANSSFDSIGATADTEEATEIVWGSSGKTIGTKDENHRTRYGIIIEDPKSNGASDQVVLKIPGDAVRAKINVIGPETTVTTSGGEGAVSLGGVPVAKLDTEVTDKTANHLILVGGPAVNKLTAEAMGLSYPTYGADSGIPENKGLLKLVDGAFAEDKVVLVVAGWNPANTRDACDVLQDYQSYDLAGDAMEVSAGPAVTEYTAPAVEETEEAAEEETEETEEETETEE